MPPNNDDNRPLAQRGYTLRLILPGVTRENIMVALGGGYVEIHGRARVQQVKETPDCQLVEEEETISYQRVPIPADADLEHARVVLNDGEAVIEIPRRPSD